MLGRLWRQPELRDEERVKLHAAGTLTIPWREVPALELSIPSTRWHLLPFPLTVVQLTRYRLTEAVFFDSDKSDKKDSSGNYEVRPAVNEGLLPPRVPLRAFPCVLSPRCREPSPVYLCCSSLSSRSRYTCGARVVSGSTTSSCQAGSSQAACSALMASRQVAVAASRSR